MMLGKKVFLRLMEEKDVPHKVKWINDPEIRSTLNFDYPISEIGTKKWLNAVSGSPERRDFIVCDNENKNQIGYGGLLNIDFKNSKAESYMGIGEKDYHGKGYGIEIRNILLNYAFEELGLNKIYSYVWDQNQSMIKLNKRVGFQIEGLLREDILSHGELRNRYVMGILRKEFLSRGF